MTRVVLLSSDVDMTDFGDALKMAEPTLDVNYEGDDGAADAEVAVCWNPPKGSLGKLKNLKLVHSIAAGVDHIFADYSLPSVPVCRVVDPDLKRGMAEYVLWGVLHFFREMDTVVAQQRDAVWKVPVQRVAKDWSVGVMGLGELGAFVASSLTSLGFDVRGWARSPKTLKGVTTWAGKDQLNEFLDGLDCLVCLIPLTSETIGILNKECFGRMAKASALVNCARGGHLVVDDLLEALASGQLRGALLDVFEVEPLDQRSSLWKTPGVVITPHMASSASTKAITSQILENIGRLKAGVALSNEVRSEGY